jgi:uncharacterized protein (TIGR00369 family)
MPSTSSNLTDKKGENHKMLSSGLKEAILRRIMRIPIVETLQMKIILLSEGYCETMAPRKISYDGVFESFHGGLLMTLADSTACFAIFTKTGPDVYLTTTDMNIRFFAPCLTDAFAKAAVIKIGRTLCPVTVNLFDAHNKHVALAQVTYMLLNNSKGN